MNAESFSAMKINFDSKHGNSSTFSCFLPVHTTTNAETNFVKTSGTKNEQYYKWQFLYSIVNAGLFPSDLIGTEVHFPKGNKTSSDLILDVAIFDDSSWFEKYKSYHNNTQDLESLAWLREHLLVAVEIKKEDSKNTQEVWEKQLKAYLGESQRKFALGVLYDTERLYLFKKQDGVYSRFSDAYNIRDKDDKIKDLSLNLTDSYNTIPSFEKLISLSADIKIDRTKRCLDNLEIISGIHSRQINDAMSNILRVLDQVGMVNQTGFEILIQIMALKIYDEKQSEKTKNRFLKFYLLDNEKKYKTLADEDLQNFLNRIDELKENASGEYHKILKVWNLKQNNESHVKILVSVVEEFQDYSFVNSQKTDLYQLVFYKFATEFAKAQNAQFITPLPLIDFLVSIVNPRQNETVIDPTVGIADFLSVSYVNSKSKLDDNNIFGMDIDPQMERLASLNMLLNGDGNAKIVAKPGLGSLKHKFDAKGDVIELIENFNQKGNWDNRPDDSKLKKFDVVLTNPPFGEDRAFSPKTEAEKELIRCYELWHLYGGAENEKGKSNREPKKIDLGVIFLENAYRILKPNGRMGIILSNSIASIDSHKIARKWLLDKMRIVALFDLPANVFAETGVNTSVIIAYKPENKELERLKERDYEVFIRDIKNIGYEVKTNKRVKYFAPKYKINYDTFKVEINSDGESRIDEDFSQVIKDFRQWCKTQESTLQELFIKEK